MLKHVLLCCKLSFLMQDVLWVVIVFMAVIGALCFALLYALQPDDQLAEPAMATTPTPTPDP